MTAYIVKKKKRKKTEFNKIYIFAYECEQQFSFFFFLFRNNKYDEKFFVKIKLYQESGTFLPLFRCRTHNNSKRIKTTVRY